MLPLQLQKQLWKGVSAEQRNQSVNELISLPIVGAHQVPVPIFSFYMSEPKEDTYVFLIDISADAYHSKMLFYTIAVLKEILAKEEFDEVCVHFYTYD